MDFVNRLKKFIIESGMTSTQFADAAGIARPTLSQILNGRNKKISNELIAKLHQAFPGLNIMWLMFGDGEMMLNGVNAADIARNLDTETKVTERKDDGLFALDNDISASGGKEQDGEDAVEGLKSVYAEGSTVDNEQNNIASDTFFASNPYEQVRKKGIRTTEIPAQYYKTDHSRHIQGPDSDQRIDSTKKVAYIMVFYTDNSYEIFRPSLD